MKTMNHYLKCSLIAATIFGASAGSAMATGEPMYNFLPSHTVEENVKSSLQNNGIDISSIQVDADSQGVVQLSGQVASKAEAEAVAKLAKESEGVYAVLGQWRYESANAQTSMPEGMDPSMDSSTQGQADMQ